MDLISPYTENKRIKPKRNENTNARNVGMG